MAQYSIPAAESRYSVTMEYFRGVDLLNSPSNVDGSRSPAAPNMVRDQVGKVRKRMGYTTRTSAPNGGRINGVFFLGQDRLIHAGTGLYHPQDLSGSVFQGPEGPSRIFYPLAPYQY